MTEEKPTEIKMVGVTIEKRKRGRPKKNADKNVASATSEAVASPPVA